MKKIISVALVLTLILAISVPFETYALNQVKYNDNELFEMAKNNILISNDHIQVRKALPNEVSIINVSEGYKVLSEGFIIITEKLPAVKQIGSETQEIEVRAIGDIVIQAVVNSDVTDDEPGLRARATAILRAESKTFPDTATGYKGTTFGGKMESMEAGNSVQSMTCTYKEAGPYYNSSGGQGVVSLAESKTRTWTSDLFNAKTTSAIGKDRYFISSPATQIANAATFYCTRGTGSYSFTIAATVFR